LPIKWQNHKALRGRIMTLSESLIKKWTYKYWHKSNRQGILQGISLLFVLPLHDISALRL
jgi:hypothetical protein